MTKLKVFQIAGPFCGTRIEGEKIYNAVAPFLKLGEQVELNFDDVQIASSSFFNDIFGRVRDEIESRSAVDLILFTHLKPRHEFVLRRTRCEVTA